jgi:hypothetical protein
MNDPNFYEIECIIRLEEADEIDPYDSGFMQGFLEA